MNREMHYSVTLEVTRRCNLNCIFCGIKDNSSPILDIKQVDKFLNKIKRPLFIFVTGGEPLLVPYVFEIRERLTSSNIEQIGINTNGSLISEHNAIKLVKNYDLIEVSIDGFREIHDFLRGKKGIYEKAINGLKYLISTKRALKSNVVIGINTVITKLLIGQLKDFFDEMLQIGVDVIQFTPMLHDPNSEIYKKYGLRREHISAVRDIYDYLDKKRVLAPGMNTYYLERILEFIRGDYKPLVFCGTGRYFIHISAEGTLYPCCSFYPRKNSTVSIQEDFDLERITKHMHLMRNKYVPNSCRFCLNLYNTYLNVHSNRGVANEYKGCKTYI